MDATAPPPLLDAADLSRDDRRALRAMARHVFIRWEIMRIAYVAVLTVESGLLLSLIDGLFEVYHPATFITLAVMAAIGANVCYLLGPAAEVNLRWLGVNHGIVRYLLWSIGTLFSMVVVLGVLAEVNFIVMDHMAQDFGQTIPRPI